MKKFISLCLALVMALALAVPVSAAHTTTKEESAQLLYNLGLFKGAGTKANGTPDFQLDRAPTRAEAVVILIRLLGEEDKALGKNWACPYTDVPDWARPYIGYAHQTGLAFGVAPTLFGASKSVTASQFLTYLLRALGYQDSVDFNWDSAWTLTDALGLTSGQYNKNTRTFLRGDAVATSASALFAVRKADGKTMLEHLLASGAITGKTAVLWDCSPTVLDSEFSAFLFYPVSGSPSTFASFKVSDVTVNGQSCDTLQLTTPEATEAFLASIGLEQGGFCYVELTYDEKVTYASSYKAPDGKTYPLLTFTFHYTGTQKDGSTVSGSFSNSYYLDR